MRDVVIIGAGGFGREVLDVFDAVNARKEEYNVLGFIIDAKYGQLGTIINDKPILGGFDWLERHSHVSAICAVGAPELRRKLVMRAEALGIAFCSVIHPNAILTRWITIGAGTVITAGCILTNQITIGNHVHLNLDCTLGHDVKIHDYVTLSPGVHVSGNVMLNTGCYVGTGANILEQKSVGEWSVVGAGSTITKDVPANATVVGVPGKVIKNHESGWYLK